MITPGSASPMLWLIFTCDIGIFKQLLVPWSQFLLSVAEQGVFGGLRGFLKTQEQLLY